MLWEWSKNYCTFKRKARFRIIKHTLPPQHIDTSILSATRIHPVLDPLYGDACSAKSFEVLPLIFITDCSPIDWLQSVLKIRSFENFFLSFLNFFQASRFGGRVDHLIHPPPMYCILVQTVPLRYRSPVLEGEFWGVDPLILARS